MPKLTLNPELSIPRLLTEAIDDLLNTVGYSLTAQKPLYAQYVNGKQRITFDYGGQIKYERYWDDAIDERGPGWATMFKCNAISAMKDYDVMQILQIIGAVDYTKLPQFKNIIKELIGAGMTQGQVSC